MVSRNQCFSNQSHPRMASFFLTLLFSSIHPEPLTAQDIFLWRNVLPCRLMICTLKASSILALLALGCLWAGCRPLPSGVFEQTIEQTYPIDPAANVSVHNRDGSIRILGSDIRELKLEAIKKAYSRKQLDKIIIRVSAQPTSIAIETIFPPKADWGLSDRSGTVDYNLFVPQTATIAHMESANGVITIEGMRGASVHARLENGRLFVRNTFCDLNVAIGRGILTLFYDWWRPGTFSVNATIEHGNATVLIPGDAAFHLVAETGSGKISNDFAGTDERDGDETKKIDKVIGPSATATIEIHAIDGNIQISEQNP